MSIDSTVGRRMAKALEARPEKKFVRVTLPWIIAAAGLAIYSATLNHWASLGSLTEVANLSGWGWQIDVYRPLTWLVTFPIKLLPARIVPLALNVFSMLCAVLTLALLARSVALLPHDRTHEQREKERSPAALLTIGAAWLPPLFAALVLGLQLTFWENATSASAGGSEMLDLLLFAYVINCLLEFRLDQKEWRLLSASFVFGAAITNHWAMIGFFPLFLAALIWIRGLEFFNVRFLVRMFLFGLVGLSLYLLLPIVQGVAGKASFWEVLRANVRMQKMMLPLLFNKYQLFQADPPLWIVAIPSLVPILVISVKWPSYFGDTSKLGVAIATIASHLVHTLFLVLCVWVALDPNVRLSPRANLSGLSFLSLYYFGALSVGYLSGYFLLLFRLEPDTAKRTPGVLQTINWGMNGLVWVLFVIAAVTFANKNLAHIRMTNGNFLRSYANSLAEGLPAKDTVVLSDDLTRLLLTEAVTEQLGNSRKYIFVHTPSLKVPEYHELLRKRYGKRWPIELPKKSKAPDDVTLMEAVAKMSGSNAVCYLHPSFGYYFELFYPEAHGLVYRLNQYPTNSLLAPPPSKKLIEENDEFWKHAESAALAQITAAAQVSGIAPNASLIERWLKFAHLTKEPVGIAQLLARYYSRALDYWAVEVQKSGDLKKAEVYFELALNLNPDNVVAKINLECNRNIAAGRKAMARISKSIEDAFGAYRQWDDILTDNGPFDEPRFCYEEGMLYYRNSLLRQAAGQFERTRTLEPEFLPARLRLAEIYVISRRPDDSLRMLDEIHARPIPRTNETELLSVELSARLSANDPNGAEAAVRSALNKYPSDESLVAAAAKVYQDYGQFTNAFEMIEKQLKLTQDNPAALLNKGYICLHLGAYEKAIDPLTRVLALATNSMSELHRTALLNRAIAYLQISRWDEARRDYEALQKVQPSDFRIFYGLGEIAYRTGDTNSALRNYSLYLTNAPQNSLEATNVAIRIKELKGG